MSADPLPSTDPNTADDPDHPPIGLCTDTIYQALHALRNALRRLRRATAGHPTFASNADLQATLAVLRLAPPLIQSLSASSDVEFLDSVAVPAVDSDLTDLDDPV